jgi:hypothetical protein
MPLEIRGLAARPPTTDRAPNLAVNEPAIRPCGTGQLSATGPGGHNPGFHWPAGEYRIETRTT